MAHYHSARAIGASTYTGRFTIGTRDDSEPMRTKRQACADAQSRADSNPGATFTIVTCRFSIRECREEKERAERYAREMARRFPT